jgi:hypothetical protein
MKQYEFKHVRMEHGISGKKYQTPWEDHLMSILTEKGEQGWDLKAAYRETMATHTHLIFSREKS